MGGSEKDTGMEPWGEDLFMQRCMDLHGVDKVEAFDITTDSMCKAFRPKGEKTNAKWRPNCALTSTAAMHPFMKPFDYFECLKATQRGGVMSMALAGAFGMALEGISLRQCHKANRRSCSV